MCEDLTLSDSHFTQFLLELTVWKAGLKQLQLEAGQPVRELS